MLWLMSSHSSNCWWSWHQPPKLPVGQCGVNDAKNVLGFADGHVNYVKVETRLVKQA